MDNDMRLLLYAVLPAIGIITLNMILGLGPMAVVGWTVAPFLGYFLYWNFPTLGRIRDLELGADRSVLVGLVIATIAFNLRDVPAAPYPAAQGYMEIPWFAYLAVWSASSVMLFIWIMDRLPEGSAAAPDQPEAANGQPAADLRDDDGEYSFDPARFGKQGPERPATGPRRTGPDPYADAEFFFKRDGETCFAKGRAAANQWLKRKGKIGLPTEGFIRTKDGVEFVNYGQLKAILGGATATNAKSAAQERQHMH